MTWQQNYSRVFYHGTNLDFAEKMERGPENVDLSKCSIYTDFGRGFYVTTNLHQAKNWANYRVRPQGGVDPSNVAAVLSFELTADNDLSNLTQLSIVWEGQDNSSTFWSFVDNCRNGGSHQHASHRDGYDMVCGPVSLWPQFLAIANADQYSFHSTRAINIINGANRAIVARGTPASPTIPLV